MTEGRVARGIKSSQGRESEDCRAYKSVRPPVLVIVPAAETAPAAATDVAMQVERREGGQDGGVWEHARCISGPAHRHPAVEPQVPAERSSEDSKLGNSAGGVLRHNWC